MAKAGRVKNLLYSLYSHKLVSVVSHTGLAYNGSSPFSNYNQIRLAFDIISKNKNSEIDGLTLLLEFVLRVHENLKVVLVNLVALKLGLELCVDFVYFISMHHGFVRCLKLFIL